MKKGTTPTHSFGLPFDASMVKSVLITYAQNDVEVLSKETKDCTLEGETIAVKLTQEETLGFNHRANVQIQVRLLTMGGDALASDIKIVSVEQCLNSEVLE